MGAKVRAKDAASGGCITKNTFYAQRKTLPDFSGRVHQVGNDLLSRRCSIIGVQGLTAVFGMGTGGSPALCSPTVLADAA